MTDTGFTSDIFPVEEITLGGHTESVLRGGRHLLPLLPQALRGVEEIGVIGWGSQGPAQAQNLRDSLAGMGIKVRIGLRPDSTSAQAARTAGFTEDDGTLGEMFDVIAAADLVLLLISDAAQVELHPKVFDALQPGATLDLSHGFLVSHLHTIGEGFPDDVNVIGVCPKGMGPSVRRLYERGSGINASFAVEQDVDGWATDLALAWSVAIGSPCTFRTTLQSECTSDVFGERGVLLGGLHGVVEALYRRLVDAGSGEELAFERSCETITGPAAAAVSTHGLRGLPAGHPLFRRAYSATYAPVLALLEEIYDEVADGLELRSVVLAGSRLDRHPMPELEGTAMWRVGAGVRSGRATRSTATPIDPFAAGVFAALMVAQTDVLADRGHPWSEIANESVIEVVDSLIPYMHERGVAHMIDNCSTTARLGARKWGPRFEAALQREALPAADRGQAADEGLLDRFETHPIHEVLDTIRSL